MTVDLKKVLKPALYVGHFTRTGNRTLLFDVAGIVKPECCTCSQGQVLQQNHWDNVAEYSFNWTFCIMLHLLEDTWLQVQPL